MTIRNVGRDVGRFGKYALIVAACVLLTAPPVLGIENETFGLVPQPQNVDNTERRTFSIPLEAGAVFEDQVRIYNRTDQALDLIVYPADAETGVDGTISVGFRGSRPKGVGAWIALDRDALSLPPRGESVINLRVEVRSADPAPDLGAIVVENAERGIAADLAERLHIVVRTSSPNSPTTSVRVRPLLLRSPWIILATMGLLLAFVIVWLGARRARRPKDTLVPTGGLREAPETEETPAASKPILRRLGESQSATAARRRNSESGVARRSVRSSRTHRAAKERNELEREAEEELGPILDELLVQVDEPDEQPAPVASRPVKRRPARTTARKAPRKEDAPRGGKYIPLDDL